MRATGRWAWREPWMAGTALIATVCATTTAAVRWLAVLGIVRDYAVTRTSGFLPPAVGGFGFTSSSAHRQLGLLSGPSAALTHVDGWTWKVGFVAGVLWVLRLGLRSANRRIGPLRGFGVISGFALFVVTGVAHDIAEAVRPTVRTRDRMHLLITLWCCAAVATAVLVATTTGQGAAYSATPGDHAVLAPIGWSIARNAMQLLVVVAGWSLAFSLTRAWVERDLAGDAERSQLRADA